MSNLEMEIRQFIIENYVLTEGMEQLDGDESLMDRGIIDSIGVFALVDFIEQQYSITVSDGEITPENLDSINRIVAFIISKKDLDTLTAA
jgi:acyl carrier protein